MAARCIPTRQRWHARLLTAIRCLLLETQIAQLELQRATEIALGGTAADVEQHLNNLRAELRIIENA